MHRGLLPRDRVRGGGIVLVNRIDVRVRIDELVNVDVEIEVEVLITAPSAVAPASRSTT